MPPWRRLIVQAFSLSDPTRQLYRQKLLMIVKWHKQQILQIEMKNLFLEGLLQLLQVLEMKYHLQYQSVGYLSFAANRIAAANCDRKGGGKRDVNIAAAAAEEEVAWDDNWEFRDAPNVGTIFGFCWVTCCCFSCSNAKS